MQQEYNEWLEKFERKKTSDDCYTPEDVYDCVADWVSEEYGLDRGTFVRPFWPDTEYTEFPYPEVCVVVDNPPFSLITKIVRFYMDRGVRFFLFSPGLTTVRGVSGITHIVVGVPITYDNGAKIPTGFITNLEPQNAVRTAPELVVRLSALPTQKVSRALPRYTLPDNVVTLANLGALAKRGIEFCVASDRAVSIEALDEMKKHGKKLFGAGWLVAQAQAQAQARRKWELSEREREIIANLK